MLIREILTERCYEDHWKFIPDLNNLTHTKLLWHSDYWDGPISGLMIWRGQIAWFQMYRDEYEDYELTSQEREDTIKAFEDAGLDWDEYDLINSERYRLYKVYMLSKKELEDIEYNHALFVKMVGQHTDYDDNNKKRVTGTINPDFKKYYDEADTIKRPVKLDLSEKNVIGKFRG